MNAAIKPEKSNYYESTWPQSVLQCNIEKKMQFIELLSIINRKDTRQLHLNNYVESIKFIMLFFFVRFFF